MEINDHPLPSSSTDIATTYACILASAEVGLGSLLHAFHLPLTGQFLSLNQCFLLSHAMIIARPYQQVGLLPAGISSIAATLKSLAPAGKKLTPMLAIAMQGWLYSVGTLCAGNTVVGRALGAGLSSLWAFVQPLIFVGFVFGLEWKKLSGFAAAYLPLETVTALIALVVVAKMLAAMGLSFLALALPQGRVEAYLGGLSRFAQRQGSAQSVSASTHPSIGAELRRTLGRPLFLLPFILTLVFALLLQSPWTVWVWILLRPLAMVCILLVLGRLLMITGLGKRLTGLMPAQYRTSLAQAWQRFRR